MTEPCSLGVCPVEFTILHFALLPTRCLSCIRQFIDLLSFTLFASSVIHSYDLLCTNAVIEFLHILNFLSLKYMRKICV